MQILTASLYILFSLQPLAKIWNNLPENLTHAALYKISKNRYLRYVNNLY